MPDATLPCDAGAIAALVGTLSGEARAQLLAGLLAQLTAPAAAEPGRAVLYVALELGLADLVARFLGALAGRPWSDLCASARERRAGVLAEGPSARAATDPRRGRRASHVDDGRVVRPCARCARASSGMSPCG
jgi:hypothetical protein